jgi:hypothetical protein
MLQELLGRLHIFPFRLQQRVERMTEVCQPIRLLMPFARATGQDVPLYEIFRSVRLCPLHRFIGQYVAVIRWIDVLPTPTEEFKVQSHIDKREYGGVLDGVVNMASRSGTKQFHGST